MRTTAGRKATGPQQVVSASRRTNADLQRELAESNAERAEALRKLDQALAANHKAQAERDEAQAREAATAEVLQLINSSPSDLAPVFDAMLEKALRLCGAIFGEFRTLDGERFRLAAVRGVPAPYAAYYTAHATVAYGPGTGPARILAGEDIVHIPDLVETEPYRRGDPDRRRLVELGGARAILLVALRRDAATLGYIMMYRQEPRPFSDKQIALLQNFAAQAVIAMENARLITETREALEQQTATAEVLQVINSSPGELAPVFDAMLEKALRICDATFGTLAGFDGEGFPLLAAHGIPEAYLPLARYRRPTPGMALHRLIEDEALVHVEDITADQVYQSGNSRRRDFASQTGARTAVWVALRKDAELLGAVTIYRKQVRPFTDKQIALLQNFAAQAVIAMENARLLDELQQRTGDLEEALKYQTATSGVLKVISRSTFDLQPVLQTLLDTAIHLCGNNQGQIWRLEGSVYRVAVSCGLDDAYREIEETLALRPASDTLVGRTAIACRPVHIVDPYADPDYAPKDDARVGRMGSMLGVPLMRGGVPVGVITTARESRIQPFSDRQIELVRTFADQAVIAIENTRLLSELRESLEQQQAMAEVLQVVNASPGELAPVFDAMLEKAMRLCGATYAALWTIDDGQVHLAAVHGAPQIIEALRALPPSDPDQGVLAQRFLQGESVVHIDDTTQDPAYTSRHPRRRAVVEIGGTKTLLGVPLHKDGILLGYITAHRQEVQPFSDKQIALLQNFAAQAVIAMENARLLEEIRTARDAAETALGELKAAQASLIQAEKMASLGQLTAGIAHEIKNPLNFVNNFAGLSVELLDELKEGAAPALATLDEDQRADLDDTMEMLTGNLEKIAEHGQRADNIVKSMLEHSRGVSGERRAVDLNALVDEALNLAYHGARAQDTTFNVTMERDFAAALKPIELVPQEMTRVFLNLIGNGFYAAIKRSREDGNGSYRPTLSVATRDDGDAIVVKIRDNGTGIAPEVRDKLFQPFFTTKPTGEGTGLGLSISYDIVTQQHGGTIEVESELGAFTEFTLRLPRNHHPAGTSA